MPNNFYCFVHTDHPSHRQGGMNDCIGVFDTLDDALAAANAHLEYIWSMPNAVEIGYVDVLGAQNGEVWHYKRYRHEQFPFFVTTTYVKESAHDPTPY